MVLGRVGMHTTTRLDELRTEEHELAVLSGRVAQADQAALPALYDRTSARVYGLALRILRDQSAAEEVALDVHLQVHRQASRFDPARGHALAWLLTLARTRAIDRLRVESRRHRREAPLDPGAELPSLASDPDESVAASQLQPVMRASFQRLSAEQRQVLELAYYSGLTQSEIAEELRLPLGTVKTRIRSGMLLLRRERQPLLGESQV